MIKDSQTPKGNLMLDYLIKEFNKIGKEVGDTVYVDGYTSFSQQNAGNFLIEKKEYRFDEIAGEKFPIYYVDSIWFDGRNGEAYNNEKCMYYIDLK